MKLLTPEEGKLLKAGDKVNVYWFSPRAPKGEKVPSIQWDGREVFLESVWRNETIAEAYYADTYEVEGPLVKLVGRPHQGFSVKKMELISEKE